MLSEELFHTSKILPSGLFKDSERDVSKDDFELSSKLSCNNFSLVLVLVYPNRSNLFSEWTVQKGR